MTHIKKNKTSFFISGFTQSALFTIISRLSGFVRDMFMAAFLGAGVFSDIFLIAFKLPNLFRRITAEGAFTSAFLPIYSQLKIQNGNDIAFIYLKKIFYRVAVFLFILMIIFQILMPFVIHFLAPGFSNNEEVINQITTLSRITIIFMPIISIVALLGVATNVSGKFWVLAFTPTILNLSLILGCLFINDYWTIKSLPLAFATVIGGIIQILFIMIMIKKFKIFNYKNLKKQNEYKKENKKIKFQIIQTWKKFLPAAVGSGILQLNLLVDTILASLLGFGSISYLYFADRVAQLPLGIIGIALGTTLLTSLSKSNAIKDEKQFSKELIISFKIGLFFSIPATFVFMSFSDLIIKVLFERGEFGSQETIQTSRALLAYAFGIPAFIMLKSCQPAFLAKGNTKTPMYVGLILLILNISLSLTLMNYLKHAGIALATSIVSWIGIVIYMSLLSRNGKILKLQDWTKKEDLKLVSVLFYGFKIIFSSSLMVLSMKYVLYVSELNDVTETLILVIICSFGFFIYILTSYIFKYIPQELLNSIVLKIKKAK